MLIDYIVLGCLVVAFVFGVVRGIVSQIMAIVGLVVSYFFAPIWGKSLGIYVQNELGCSTFAAQKVSVLLVGVAIYVACRLIGYGIEKLAVNRVQEFKKLNRVGGGVLGAVKGAAMLAIFFFFVSLVPESVLRHWVPKLTESHSYQIASKYNPMGNRQVLDHMRLFRGFVRNPEQQKKLKENAAVERLLEKHQLKNALHDEKFMKSLETGDYDQLRKTENVEKLMNDDELTSLLGQLEKK